ncbi:MAG: hypothetical protein IME98_02415, partial [Proteobacteria bacterium]|nr:hypothetical protein [Pseudomonadota bacterium]
GRDTYSESDELLLSRQAELLKEGKARRTEELSNKDKEPAKEPVKDAKEAEITDEEGADGKKKKHVNIIV